MARGRGGLRARRRLHDKPRSAEPPQRRVAWESCRVAGKPQEAVPRGGDLVHSGFPGEDGAVEEELSEDTADAPHVDALAVVYGPQQHLGRAVPSEAAARGSEVG